MAYLKEPPTGYQQPAIDIVAKLAEIEGKVNSGYYQNQYAFEQDIYLLTYAAHDQHLDLSAGILSVFSFAAPFYISSVSVDGKQAPQIYLTGKFAKMERLAFANTTQMILSKARRKVGRPLLFLRSMGRRL